MKILVDVDGIIRNIVPTIIDLYKKYDKDFPYTENDIPELDTFELFNKCDFQKDICIEHATEVFLKSPAYEVEVSNLIFLIGDFEEHEFVICSKQQPQNEWLTNAWLDNHGIKIDRIYTSEKHLVDAEVLIDDCPSNLQKFSKKGKAICLRRPWNEKYKGTKINTLSELQYIL
jgi:5'(3')-deoxyribonucleotidase